MKNESPELKAARAQGTTAFAWCWYVERLDGVVFGFTSVDKNLTIDGVEYVAATGFTPSSMQQNADLSVPNLEVDGFLDSDSITEADLLAGKWDGAYVSIFEVNYDDLSMGRMILRTGNLGNVSAGRSNFKAELRGVSQSLQQPVGRVYSPSCDAVLGDARCKVDIDALTVSGEVTDVAGQFRTFSDSSLTQPSDYFGGGELRWLNGANAGISIEVGSFDSGDFALVLPMAYPIEVGDTFEVVPGCRKRFEPDCRDKFSNVINFRGFPHVPLNDVVLGSAGLGG